MKEIVQLKMKCNIDFSIGDQVHEVWADTEVTLAEVSELRKMYPEEVYRVVTVQEEKK